MTLQDERAKTTRRKHDAVLKGELIERTFAPGASVSAIALEHGLNANLLFKWRRMHVRADASARGESPMMLPVVIDTAGARTAAPPMAIPRAASGVIEIDIGAARVRVRGPVDDSSLRCVLQALGAPR